MGTVDLAAPIPARGITVTGTSTGSTSSAGTFVRIGLDSGQSPGLEPLLLRAGQRLLADVLAADSLTGRAIISIAGRRVETQLPATQPPIQPGDVIRLAVTETLPDRITLRLEESAPRPPRAAQMNAAAVLSQLDLPDSPPLRAALNALVERALPVQREAILAIRNAVIATPSPAGDSASETFLLDAARAAVRLRQDGVPLTPRSLQLGHAAIAGPYALPLGTLLGDLLRLIDSDLPPGGEPDTPGALATSEDAAGGASGAPGAPRTGLLLPGGASQTGARAAIAPAAGEATTRPASTVLASPDVGSPTLVSLSATGDARAALASLIAAPTPGALQRALEALLQAPEAQLASIIAQDDAALPQAASSPLPAVGPRVALSNLATARASLGDLATPSPTGPSGAPGSPPTSALVPARGDASLPSPPLSVVVTTGNLDGQAYAQTPGAPDARSAAFARAVGALATALHDRLELQQLRAAASLGQQAEAAPTQLLPAGASIPPASIDQIDGAALLLRTPDGQGNQSGVPTGMPLVFSLPVAMGGQLTTLDLTVQPDKDHRGAGGASSPAIRASFSVHLERLGEVGADVRLSGATLRCRLRAGSDSALNAMSNAVEPLRARLQHAGFTVEALDCTLSDAPPSPPPTILHHVSLDA